MYYLANTITMEQQAAETEKVKNAALVAGVLATTQAMDKNKSNLSRTLYGTGAVASFGVAGAAQNEINSLLSTSSSTFNLAIAYSNLSVGTINLLKMQNIEDNTLQNIFNSVFVNWKGANLNLLRKIKLNLISKLKKLKSDFYNPQTILKQKEYDYSDFHSFELTLDLLGLDEHSIIKDNKIGSFVEDCKSAYNENVNVSEMKKHKGMDLFLNISYIVLIIAGVIAFFNDVFSWWAVLGLVIYIPVSILLNHGAIHKRLSKKCQVLSAYLEKIDFSEKDIELDKIGLD